VPRPDPRFDDIDMLESRANSNYHACRLDSSSVSQKGLAALVSYTFSKSIDDARTSSAAQGIQTFRRIVMTCEPSAGVRTLMYAPAIRVLLLRSNVWKGSAYLADAAGYQPILSGWQSFASLPCNRAALHSGTLSDYRQQRDRSFHPGLWRQRPANVSGGSEYRAAYYRPLVQHSCFYFFRGGTFGNAGRNILDGPGYQNVTFRC